MKINLPKCLWSFLFLIILFLNPTLVWASSFTNFTPNDSFQELTLGIFGEDNRALSSTQNLQIIDAVSPNKN
jgi:hypothetical protein